MLRFPRHLPGILVMAGTLAACGGGEERTSGAATGAAGEPVARDAIPVESVTRREPLVDRLLLVGLDGATWDLLDPLLAKGRLPNLDALIRNGVRAPLRTMEPTLSPAIWTTMATGFLPEQHGILGFDGVPGQTMTTLPNATMRQRKTFWNVLSDFGITTGTVGWWASWPADPLPAGSFLISDRVPYTRMEAAVGRAPLDAGDVQPRELRDVAASLVEKPDDIAPEVVERFLKLDDPDLRDRFVSVDYRMGDFLPEFKFVYQSDRSTVRMALAAFDELPVDVLSVYLTGIDTVSHLYWHFAFPEEFP
ncbi:MAG TPA: alkaline phosphatase family protein, partial [bacterium]|nr:alkaline phosphatase family protein [bacterium]